MKAGYQEYTDFAAHSFEQGLGPGERNPSNPSNNYTSTRHECNSTVLAAGTAAQSIGAGGTTPVFLMGIYVNAALVGTVTVVGFTNPDGSPASFVIPVGASGWVLAPGNARRCEGGCTVQKSSASDDGKVLVDWRPML